MGTAGAKVARRGASVGAATLTGALVGALTGVVGSLPPLGDGALGCKGPVAAGAVLGLGAIGTMLGVEVTGAVVGCTAGCTATAEHV